MLIILLFRREVVIDKDNKPGKNPKLDKHPIADTEENPVNDKAEASDKVNSNA